MHWRDQQLEAFGNTCMIKQDADLVLYIKQNHIKECAALGDVEYFSQYIKFTDSKSNFGILIQNTPFYWQQLADTINQFLEEKIVLGGILYLAVNKYFAEPVVHDPVLSEDYDQAIYQFVQHHVNASITSYNFSCDDQGLEFNFAHPLSRFYLQRYDY